MTGDFVTAGVRDAEGLPMKLSIFRRHRSELVQLWGVAVGMAEDAAS